MSRLYIGIDPGNTGALAAIYPSGEVRLWDAPRNVPNEIEMAEIVHSLGDAIPRDEQFAVIEWAQSSPKMGVTSAFNYGCGFGMWLATLASHDIGHVRVRPQEWMSMMFSGRKRLSRDKTRSIGLAKKLFPLAPITLAKHHGRAEALLIAEYGRRTYDGT